MLREAFAGSYSSWYRDFISNFFATHPRFFRRTTTARNIKPRLAPRARCRHGTTLKHGHGCHHSRCTTTSRWPCIIHHGEPSIGPSQVVAVATDGDVFVSPKGPRVQLSITSRSQFSAASCQTCYQKASGPTSSVRRQLRFTDFCRVKRSSSHFVHHEYHLE